MKIKSIVILLACLLLLSGLTVPATACCEGDPPGEPSCYVCEDGAWVLEDGADCGVDSDCGPPGCWNCVNCQCEYQCNDCQVCWAGSCVLRYGAECAVDLDCEYGGEGCESCVDCICEDDDSKCASDECCDDGTCVPKCTNTGQCDYGELPSGPYPNCEVLKDDATGRCAEAEGFVCNHSVIIAQNDAQCADCEPNCAKTRICACAEIIPYKCTTHCSFFLCICTCDEKYEERTYRGDHYECD